MPSSGPITCTMPWPGSPRSKKRTPARGALLRSAPCSRPPSAKVVAFPARLARHRRGPPSQTSARGCAPAAARRPISANAGAPVRSCRRWRSTCSSAQPSPSSRTTCASQSLSNSVRAMHSREPLGAQRVPLVRAETPEGVGHVRAGAAAGGAPVWRSSAQRAVARRHGRAEQQARQDRQPYPIASASARSPPASSRPGRRSSRHGPAHELRHLRHLFRRLHRLDERHVGARLERSVRARRSPRRTPPPRASPCAR